MNKLFYTLLLLSALNLNAQNSTEIKPCNALYSEVKEKWKAKSPIINTYECDEAFYNKIIHNELDSCLIGINRYELIELFGSISNSAPLVVDNKRSSEMLPFPKKKKDLLKLENDQSLKVGNFWSKYWGSKKKYRPSNILIATQSNNPDASIRLLTYKVYVTENLGLDNYIIFIYDKLKEEVIAVRRGLTAETVENFKR